MADFSQQPDTKWSKSWRNPTRWRNGRFVTVRFSPRSYWLSRVDGETKPTQHSSREAAMRAADKRAQGEG